jgi:hypothetical protein
MANMIPLSDDLGNSANKLFGPSGGLTLQSLVATDNGQKALSIIGSSLKNLLAEYPSALTISSSDPILRI